MTQNEQPEIITNVDDEQPKITTKVDNETILSIQNLSFSYNGVKQIVKDVSMDLPKNKVIALIGPSGCGKSTLLRCINRIHDLYPDRYYQGKIMYHDKNILASDIDLMALRSEIAMIFQKATPFPMSIFENIAYPLRLRGVKDKDELMSFVVSALKDSALYEEVEDKLHKSALELSGGQQQRLSIARALPLGSELMLLDEPTSALDPKSTNKIEKLIARLKERTTVVIVTHNMQQALRVADRTAFLYDGELVEYGTTTQIFHNPQNKRTHDYVLGKFG